MSGLRTAAYALVVALFVAFAYAGLNGWMRARSSPDSEARGEDERPLETGGLVGHSLAHFGSMGYPWEKRREELVAVKRDLPPDPAPLSAEDAEKAHRTLLASIEYEMPAGRLAWPEIVAALRERIEPLGVKVLTPPPQPPDDYTIDLPAKEWVGTSVLYHLRQESSKLVAYTITSEGLVVGTDDSCNRGTRDAKLVALRRRVAEETADPRLDAAFRPDLVDATIVAFARAVEAQTGIEVAVDAEIWETGPALAWRGPPRKLRDALNEVCSRFRWYWRFQGGRVWLLKP